MAGNEHRLIAHGPQALADAAEQLLVVALRKIGAANAAGEQHIAHKHPLRGRAVKHHMAWRVARAVAHGQGAVPNRDRVAIGQPTRGREVLRERKTKHLALLRQAVDPKLITGVRPHDGQTQAAGQLTHATGVVDVRVREPNGLERHTQSRHLGQQHVQITTGVDDRGVHGFVAPHDGAVLRKGGDGDGEVLEHSASIGSG